VVGRCTGFRVVIQDQDSVTADSYTHVILADDGSGNPSLVAAEILRTAPIRQPSGTGGPAAWLITDMLATPADVLPQQAVFHHGIGLPPNAAWTADGLSVHAASYTVGPTGDNPKASAPSWASSISRPTGGSAILNPTPAVRTHRLSLMVAGGVLNAGADIDPAKQRGPNPCFGVAGMYPDQTRLDGLALRYRDAARTGGVVAVFGSIGILSPGLRIPGVHGFILLDVQAYLLELVGGAPIPQSGEVSLTLLPFPYTLELPYLTFQAVAIGGGPPAMSLITGKN
jgi:hypothetical protein